MLQRVPEKNLIGNELKMSGKQLNVSQISPVNFFPKRSLFHF